MCSSSPAFDPCSHIVDELIRDMSVSSSAQDPLLRELALAWSDTHDVYRLLSRQSWVSLAQREMAVGPENLTDRITQAIVADQRSRPGLMQVWNQFCLGAQLPLLMRWTGLVQAGQLSFEL